MIGLSLIAPVLWAGMATQNPPTLTLEEALNIAESNAFAVRIAESDVEKTRQRVNEAKGNLGPQVRVNNVYTRYDEAIRSGGALIRPIDNLQSQVTLSMPFDVTGVLKKGVNATEFSIRVAKENLAAEKNDLRYSVKAAYYDVLQARAQVKVFQETLDSAQSRLKNTELEFEAGSKAKVDVLRFQTQVQQAESDLITAKNFLRISRNAFNNTLGRPIETPFDLVEPSQMPQPELDEKALTETAKSNRPELRAYRYNQEVLKNIRMAQESGMLPSLNISAVHSRDWDARGQGANDQTTFGQVTLAVPVFDSGITRARVKAARQDEQQNRIRMEQFELSVSLEVRQAVSNLENARATWEAAQKQVEYAAETFRLANLRYEAGEGILLEVTDAQAELTRARTNLVNATYGYLTSYAQLQRALGTEVPKPELVIAKESGKN